MAKGIFLYREDSRYEDRPWAVYQFPPQYLSRASQMVGDWVIFMEPAKAGRKGYHAVGKVDQITPDPRNAGSIYAASVSTSAGSTVSRRPIALRIDRMVSNDGFPSSPSAL